MLGNLPSVTFEVANDGTWRAIPSIDTTTSTIIANTICDRVAS